MSKTMHWLVTIFISIALSLLSVFIYDKFFAQKIVAVDIKGFLEEQKRLYLQGKLTEDEFKTNIDKLETAITNVPKNKAILNGEMVIRNVEVLNVKAK